jgi:hypothetical protein
MVQRELRQAGYYVLLANAGFSVTDRHAHDPTWSLWI